MPNKKVFHGGNRLLKEFIRTGATQFQPLVDKLPAMLGNNEAEIEKCNKDPRYFYNKHLRQDGEPVVTYQLWNKVVTEIHGPGAAGILVDAKLKVVHKK